MTNHSIEYKNHTIMLLDAVVVAKQIIGCIFDEHGALVHKQAFYQENNDWIFNDFNMPLKAKIDEIVDMGLQDISDVMPKVYRHDGLKYIALRRPAGALTFVKGVTKYVFSHKHEGISDKEITYHYKALPIVGLYDYVKIYADKGKDNNWAQVIYIEQNDNGFIYFVKFADMNIMRLEQFDSIIGHYKAGDVPSDIIISDRNNERVSLRLPKYLVDILKNNSEADMMSLSETVREALLYALDMYMRR